jgi:hypothetical protein
MGLIVCPFEDWMPATFNYSQDGSERIMSLKPAQAKVARLYPPQN